jgi:Ran GTPase-activating protein (RanGAP) involved in mRNA processing and transport
MHDVAYIIKHYGSGLLSVRFCSDSSQSANTAFTVEAMLQALTPLRSLTKLLFICERLPRRAVRVVCRLIRSQRSLVELELDCSSLYGPTAFTLAKVIRKNSSLETLRLRNGFLSKRACKALAGAICSSRSIRCVSWKRDLPYLLCPMPLLEYMSRDLCFKRLEFSGQDCRRPEVLAIARSLVHGSDLEELRLVDKGSNSCNVLLIGRALSVNDKLRSLSLNASQKCWHTDLLSENMEVYCEEFGAALANNRTLQNLQLCFCYISDIGCSSLSRGLMRNVCLATLDLSSNAIGDRGVGALADALRENSSLESLRLLDCRATDDGVGKLVDALYVNDRLKHLEVSQASYHLQHTDTSRVAGLSVYGEIVGRRVLNVLATNHSLQTLDLATCLPDYDIQRTYYLRLNQMGRHYLRNGASIGTTREAALRSIYKSIHDVDCIFFVVKTCAQDLFRSGTSREF